MDGDTVQSQLKETIHYIRARSTLKPKLGMVLGSGLGAFVDRLKIDVSIPFDEIPFFNPPTVEGHSGRLVLGSLDDLPIAVLQGRVHYYEGHSMAEVVYPIRTLAMLGTETLILTNSAGGIDPQMQPGDFMIIEDHINLMGDNPLKGPNLKNLGPRFPDMTEAYDRQLIEKMESILSELKIRHSKGIYCGVSGPTYETPAEVRFLQMIGGKAVGMSTVPETIAANHMGIRVAALSCITNAAAGLSQNKLSHSEVTERAKSVERSFCDFLVQLVGTFKVTSDH
jgi:purine-nucleoside phosphorylase